MDFFEYEDFDLKVGINLLKSLVRQLWKQVLLKIPFYDFLII